MNNTNKKIVDFEPNVEYPIGTLVRFNNKIVCKVIEKCEFSGCGECYCSNFMTYDFCDKAKCTHHDRSDKKDIYYDRQLM